MHKSQAIDGSTWESRKVSEPDKENIPETPIIPEKMLSPQTPVNRLQFLEYLFMFGVFCTANPDYLLNNDVKSLNSVNMKPFIKGPGNNPLEVKKELK